MAEANSQGEIIRRYIYLDDKVVGVWQHDLFYAVHGDQRGAPEAISNIQGRTVWQAQMDPWGRVEIDADPDRDGQTFVFNLRLPGQIEDRETGTYYNYQRDYDPRTGRYLTPDPSGQAGGLNTYLYAKANPLRYSDPLGLAPISAEDLNGDVDSYNYSGPTPGSSCLESELYFGEAIAKLAEAYGGSEAGRILYSWPITDSISFIIERASQQVSASSQHGVPLFNPSNPSHPVTGSLNGNQINVLGDQLAILPSYGQDQIVFAVRKGATEAQIYNDLRERLGNLVTEQDVRHLMESVYGGSDVADKDYVIDLFPLYEEITTRFQTRLQTAQGVIDAEYQAAAATAALRNYLAENRNEDCRTQGNNGDSAACENMRLHRRLNEELAGAYEQYQQSIQHEYQNLVGRGYLPQLAAYQDDIAARGDAWRQAGEFGIALAGIFIPMTLADLAIDLATAETVIGPIARRIERATEAVRIMFKGSDELAAATTQRLTSQTVEASKRIVAVRYPHLTELGVDNILENPTIARYLSQRGEWSDDLLHQLDADLGNEKWKTELTELFTESPEDLDNVWRRLKEQPDYAWELRQSDPRWEKWSKREFFKNATANGRKFEEETVLPRLRDRTSAEYLQLKETAADHYGVNLDEYDMYSSVQLRYGDQDKYFVADQVYVKWGVDPESGDSVVSDFVVIENKLKETTKLTTNQSQAKSSDNLIVRSIEKEPESSVSGNLLAKDEGMNGGKWIKIHDAQSGDEISGMAGL